MKILAIIGLLVWAGAAIGAFAIAWEESEDSPWIAFSVMALASGSLFAISVIAGNM